MKLARPALICLVTVAAFAISDPALAVGLGMFFDLEAGEGEWEFDDWDNTDHDADFGAVAFGFVMDTAPAQDRVFNYRLKAGFSYLESDLDDFRDEFELYGIVTDHTFGFGVVRNETMRLWIGPNLRTSIHVGELDYAGAFGSDDVVMVGFGVGPAIGANFHVGPNLTLSVETGCRLFVFGGENGDWDDYDDDYDYDYDTDVVGAAGTLYGGFSILFRTGADRH